MGSCYLYSLCYIVLIQSNTVTNGLRLPFTSLTSKATPVKPSSSSLNCSSVTGSINARNIAPNSLTLSPNSFTSCQENLPAVNLNSFPRNGNSNYPNLFSTSNNFQGLPQVNVDPAATSMRSVNSIENFNTFKFQNLTNSITGSSICRSNNKSPRPLSSLEVAPISSSICQKNLPAVNLNAPTPVVNLNTPNIYNAPNYFQQLPKVYVDSSLTSIPSVYSIDCPSTFKIQNSLPSTIPHFATGSVSSQNSNTVSKPLNVSQIARETCQNNIPVGELKSSHTNTNSPNLCTAANYFQVLPKANSDSTALRLASIHDIDNSKTFRVQNPLPFFLRNVPDINLYPTKQSINPNINNDAFEKANMVQNNMLSNTIPSLDDISSISSSINTFNKMYQGQNLMTSLPDKNKCYQNNLNIENTLPSNVFYDLPKVHINKNPMLSLKRNVYPNGQTTNSNVNINDCQNTNIVQPPVQSNSKTNFDNMPLVLLKQSNQNPMTTMNINPVQLAAITNINNILSIPLFKNVSNNSFKIQSPMKFFRSGNNDIYRNEPKIQNPMIPNAFQDLPDVNLNTKPYRSESFNIPLSPTLPVLNTQPNPTYNFFSKGGVISNQLNPLTTPVQSNIPPLSNNATNSFEDSNNLINLNQNTNILPTSYCPQAFSSVLSNSQSKINSPPTNVEPQIKTNPFALPAGKIILPSSGSKFYFNNNKSPIEEGTIKSSLPSQANLNPQSPRLESISSNPVSSCTNFQSSNPFMNNAIYSSNFKNVLSPSTLTSPMSIYNREISTQPLSDGQIKSSNIQNPFSPESVRFVNSLQYADKINCESPPNINQLPGVSLGCNTVNQYIDNFGGYFVSQNIQSISPDPKQLCVISNDENQLTNLQLIALNGLNTITAPDLTSSSQTVINCETVPSIQNEITRITNSRLSPNYSIGPISQIISSNPMSKTELFPSELTTLPEVALSALNKNKNSFVSQALPTDKILMSTPPPQNCVNPSLYTWLNNLPITKISYLPNINTNCSPFTNNNYISSPNFMYPVQTSETSFSQINTIPQTNLFLLNLDTNTILNSDSAKDYFERPSIPSNTLSRLFPQTTSSKFVCQNMLPNPVIPQPTFEDFLDSNNYSKMNSRNSPSVNLPKIWNQDVSCPDIQTLNLILSSDNFRAPQSCKPDFHNNICDKMVPSLNPLTNLPSGSFEVIDSALCSDSNVNLNLPTVNIPASVLNFKSVGYVPSASTINSNPYSIVNNAVYYIPLTSLPEVSCTNDFPLYQTNVNPNFWMHAHIDGPNYSKIAQPSVSSINYINTCSDSVSPLSEFTSSLTKSIINGVFSGDFTLKPTLKIPTSLPPVNSYSNVNSVPSSNNFYAPTVFQDKTIHFGSKTIPSNIDFDSISTHNPFTLDNIWSDSNDFTSSIPLTKLPLVIPCTKNEINGNFGPRLLSPSFSPSNTFPSSNPPDLDILYDNYTELLSTLTSDLSQDYANSYHFDDQELFKDCNPSPYNYISKSNFADIMPYVSDFAYSSPSFLPPPNVMSGYAYPPPIIKLEDKEFKELERLLEYIIFLELMDSNYNCDWELLEKTLAMLYTLD